MALHGEIKVNGVAIATWEAVRKEKLAKDINWYDCKVHYRNPHGYPMKAEFSVPHRFGDGALALTAKVIGKSEKHLAPRFLGDEEEQTDFPV